MEITKLSGVGVKRAEALAAAGINTVADLLNHFPRDYDDRSNVKTIAELTPDAVNTLRGVVAYEPENASLRLIITKAVVKDHTGTLELVWFNQPYLKKYFKKGGEYIFTGKVRALSYGGADAGPRLQMQSPDYEPSGNGVELSGGRIVPIYTPPKQFSQKTFRALIHQALQLAGTGTFSGETSAFFEFIPSGIREKFSLCGREIAVRNIHFPGCMGEQFRASGTTSPGDDALFLAARRRLVFEELFFMQLTLASMKTAVAARPGLLLANTDYMPFLQSLPFAPTKAQIRVLGEIVADISGGNQMNRLIQGDVGSGKTAVAMAASYLAVKNGYQSAMMAPTDVLANQLYAGFKKIFTPLGFEPVLLTGSLSAKTRRDTLTKITDGRAPIIIGTHALIQAGVNYNNLGLCITDEQHRFGVNQRLSLTRKGNTPHTLVMTATPIPRTLGLILYGDLDISVIDELPPDRQEIKTYCVDSRYRERVHGFIRKETEQGQQVYIICPAISAAVSDGMNTGDMHEETHTQSGSKAEMQNVLNYTQELSAALPGIRIAFLHGRMKPAEKEQIMGSFKSGEIQVLVSTTVIEVGVHVENATLMVIENAERFGLSQLHQLRGRVGRSGLQSYCVMLSDIKNEQTQARMKAMAQTTDGFKLAELDLEQRGSGDFFGTRQHGLPAFTIANLYRDMEILKEAQEAVLKLHEFSLTSEESDAIRRRTEEVSANIFQMREIGVSL
ncbi:MAG: ATP-dependent DNA helicase RecG [Defluviitaleaceae bacterium]|nr:ATP-dependent DNA helicase RecG [Defluviitaleaceae bacterium]